MKKLFCICAALYACFTLNAQMKPQTFDLWPQGKMPGALNYMKTETMLH